MTPLPTSAAGPLAAAREGRPYRHAGTWRPQDAAVGRGGHHHRYAVYGVIFRPPIAPDLFDVWAEASISHDPSLISGATRVRPWRRNASPDSRHPRGRTAVSLPAHGSGSGLAPVPK